MSREMLKPKILRLLYVKGPMIQAEISRELDRRESSISVAVAQLKAAGYVWKDQERMVHLEGKRVRATKDRIDLREDELRGDATKEVTEIEQMLAMATLATGTERYLSLIKLPEKEEATFKRGLKVAYHKLSGELRRRKP